MKDIMNEVAKRKFGWMTSVQDNLMDYLAEDVMKTISKSKSVKYGGRVPFTHFLKFQYKPFKFYGGSHERYKKGVPYLTITKEHTTMEFNKSEVNYLIKVLSKWHYASIADGIKVFRPKTRNKKT